jgi:MFS family permease
MKTIEQSLAHKGGVKVTMTFGQTYAMWQLTLYTPILAMIGASFADSGIWVNQSMSIVQLVMVFAILFAGWLSDRVDKKIILVLGSVIFLAGGLLYGVANSVYMLTVFRALIGLGAGLAFPIIPTYIAALFHGNERAQLMGWMNGGASICTIILSFIIGYVVASSWRMHAILYLPFVIIIILQLAYLPNLPPVKQNKEIKEEKTGFGALKVSSWIVALGMALFSLTANVYMFKLAGFVASQGIGNATETGWSTAVMGIVSTLTCFGYGLIYKRMGRFSCVLSCLLVGGAHYMLSGADSLFTLLFAMGVMGCGMGSFYPYFASTMSTTSNNAAMAAAMSLMFFAQNAGIYGASWVDVFLTPIAKTDSGVMRYIGIFYLAIAVLMALLCIIMKDTLQKYVLKNESNNVSDK